jgi:hypothetical protein
MGRPHHKPPITAEARAILTAPEVAPAVPDLFSYMWNDYGNAAILQQCCNDIVAAVTPLFCLFYVDLG